MSDHRCICFISSSYSRNSAPSMEASLVFFVVLFFKTSFAQIRSHVFFILPVSSLLNVCVVQLCSRGERTKTSYRKLRSRGLLFSSRVWKSPRQRMSISDIPETGGIWWLCGRVDKALALEGESWASTRNGLKILFQLQ